VDENDTDYFDFLEDSQDILTTGEDTSSKAITAEDLPDWVSEDNNSLAAFKAIQKLEKEKLKYIAENSTKKSFEKKSNFQIGKAEVARIVGGKPSPLFYSLTTTFSEHLLEQFDDTNKNLLKKKNNKLSVQNNGLRSRTKDTLIGDFRDQEEQLKTQVEINVDNLYTRLKAELSYDIKAKLKIN
jgi:hypothetical protein